MKKTKGALLFISGILIGSILAGTAIGAGISAQRSTQTVYVDGSRVELETYLINDSNYVKLRDVGRVIDFNVYWDGSAVQMQSKAPYTGSAPGGNTAARPVSAGVSEQTAVDTALSNAGFARSDVTALTVNQDYEDGAAVYDVKFFYGGVEYEYEIDASTGAIRGVDIDYEKTAFSESDIGREAAVSKALTAAGFSRTQVTRLTVKSGTEKGRAVYEVEFVVGGFEYEYDIDAATAEIVGSDIDSERN